MYIDSTNNNTAEDFAKIDLDDAREYQLWSVYA